MNKCTAIKATIAFILTPRSMLSMHQSPVCEYLQQYFTSLCLMPFCVLPQNEALYGWKDEQRAQLLQRSKEQNRLQRASGPANQRFCPFIHIYISAGNHFEHASLAIWESLHGLQHYAALKACRYTDIVQRQSCICRIKEARRKAAQQQEQLQEENRRIMASSLSFRIV